MTSGAPDAHPVLRPAEPPTFALQVDGTGNEVTVALVGELDMVTAPALEEGLRVLFEDGARQVTLNLEALAFVDSSGLSALVAGLKQFRAAGGDVVLRSPTRATAKVLEICGLTQIFTIEGQNGDGDDADDSHETNGAGASGT